MPIRIVKAPPGLSTTEQIWQLILASPQGITVKEICQILNRPVSMVQICLKSLQAQKQIRSLKSENQMQLVYYPRSRSKS